MIDLVENVSDALCIGMEESIQVRFVWQATLATDCGALVADVVGLF